MLGLVLAPRASPALIIAGAIFAAIVAGFLGLAAWLPPRSARVWAMLPFFLAFGLLPSAVVLIAVLSYDLPPDAPWWVVQVRVIAPCFGVVGGAGILMGWGAFLEGIGRAR